MEFSEIGEFAKEFKRFCKKYFSLDDDFQNLKEVLLNFPKGAGSKHWNMIKQREDCFIFKTRLMCRSVRGANFRVIYFLDFKNQKIVFIEIYYKGIKENEDKRRVEDEFLRLTK